MARRFGSAITSKTDSTLLLCSIRHMPVKAYNGRSSASTGHRSGSDTHARDVVVREKFGGCQVVRRIVQIYACDRVHLCFEPQVERVAGADESLERFTEIGRLHVGDQMIAGRQPGQIPEFLRYADAALRRIELRPASPIQLLEKHPGVSS